MATSPLITCEWVRPEQDDQDRHQGWQVAGSRERFFWPQSLLTARSLLPGGFLPVGDPIDVLARARESRCFDVSAHALLRPEYVRGPLALAREQVWPAPRRVCAWLWPPTHSLDFP